MLCREPVSGLGRCGFLVITIIVFGAGIVHAKPITIEQVGELTTSQLDVGIVQDLAFGASQTRWQFDAPLFKGQPVASSEAAHLVVGNSFGISTDVCLYTPVSETTATPEPMSMLLMGTGLLGAAAGIRHRRRKALNKS